MDTELTLAYRQAATLGEGVVWHGPSQRWWWTDIQGAALHAWAPGMDGAQTFRLPDRLGCFAHTRSGRLLLGLAKRLCLASFNEAGTELRLQELAPVDANEPRTRINDGRCDRSGHFVFGTLNESPEKRAIGSFYQYSRRHGLRRLALPAVAIANSICFSLDGRTLYFTDTLTQTLMCCDYEGESAQVSGIRPFARMDNPRAWPDGSVVDAEGCLWNAHWGAGQLTRYSPGGEVLERYAVPVKNPSCPALGGPQGDELIVTTARQDLRPEQLKAMPLSGSLFGLRLPRALAVAETPFDDQDMETRR